MEQALSTHIQELVRRAPPFWLEQVCAELRNSPASASTELVKKRLPTTANSDLAFVLNCTIDSAVGVVSWEALGYGLQVAFNSHVFDNHNRRIEMLWSGRQPAINLRARRIDQALYDSIENAKHEILLVTFAAAKVDRLAAALLRAARRNVNVKLVLEFAEASEGQLSFDALNAFPTDLVKVAKVYFWPVENRERNYAGKPGKLHAKLAVIDDVALVSSANLTDDAFTRNLELGVWLKDPDVVRWAREYFTNLVSNSTLQLIPNLKE